MTAQTPQPQVSDLAAIQQASMDYMQGWYEGDEERMRRSLHPELAKRAFLRDPLTGTQRFSQLNQQQMIAKTREGGADTPSSKHSYDVTILDMYGEIASVRAESYDYVDYLHLARGEDGWKIVNALWTYKSAGQ